MNAQAPDPIREEAQRLIVAAVAAASMAARGLGAAAGSAGGGSFATGSAECCVCPLCRVIAAMRDPSPDLTERLATGAGDLATGIASMLRSMSGGARSGHAEDHVADGADPDEGDKWWQTMRARAARAASPEGGSHAESADPWHEATTAEPGPTAPVAAAGAERKPMAKKAVKATAPGATPGPPAPAKKATSAPAKKAAPGHGETAGPEHGDQAGPAPAKKAGHGHDDNAAPAAAKKAAGKKAAKKAAKKAVRRAGGEDRP